MVSEARRREVESLVALVTDWAARQADIRALLMVGSWARGDPRPDSDVDLVLLTDDVARYLDGAIPVRELGAVEVIREQNWGAIEERRLRLASGLEVEVGIGKPSWANVDPICPGTRRVVTDGARALYDPDGLVGTLVSACLTP